MSNSPVGLGGLKIDFDLGGRNYFLNYTRVIHEWASQVSQCIKNPPAVQEMRETQVQSLGRGDPLEEGMEPTPVFLPGESQGRQSLVGCRLWGCTESDTTEVT